MQELRTKDYLAQKFRALRRLAGNTPLLGIHFHFQRREGRVYAKSEQLNMTGSISNAFNRV